jgi:hypothetical protein
MLDTIDPGNSGGSVIIPELPKFTVAPSRYLHVVCEKTTIPLATVAANSNIDTLISTTVMDDF